MSDVAALTSLLRKLGASPGRIVAFDAGSTATADDFVQRARAWRAMFERTGGTRHAIHLDDSFEFAAALFGAWHAGKTVWLPPDTLESTLSRLATQVDGFAGDIPDGLHPEDGASAGHVDWNDLDAEAGVLVVSTSGSQGDPMAIGKRLRQLDCEVAALESCFGGMLGDVLVHATVSHQHIYGLLFRILWPLAAGRPFARRRLGYPEQIAALDRSRPAVLVSSPALLKRLPEAFDWSAPRQALRVVFSSGGPLSPEAGASVEELWGRRAIEVLGSTETGGIALRIDTGHDWEALPGVAFRIEQGILHVRSGHLPEDDWYRTEDRACASGTGFRLLGRADRVVKLEERRISLQSIERLLLDSPLVEEARVLVLEGKRDRIAAVAVLTPTGRDRMVSLGRKHLVDELRDVLDGRVDPIANPRLWRFVPSLPSDAQGKTSHRLLADLFLSNRPAPHWRERGAQSASMDLVAASDLLVFDGHFPGTPILPGVALIDWAIAWGHEAFAIALPFARMEALKFQQLVRPDTPLRLELQWVEATATLAFVYTSARGKHASGRIVFAAADAAP